MNNDVLPNSNGKEPQGELSSDNELEDLECLDFPGDIDWSSTLVLRCEPGGGPYNLADMVNSLHEVVRRNDLFSLGPTALNHAFTLSFKSDYAMEGFIKFMQSRKMGNGLKVKGQPCSISRVPSKCVTVHVRNIPLEVDSSHVVSVLKKYGTVVKTELVKNKFRGWFHVYTNERKFKLYLKNNIKAQDMPYGIEVKGLHASVFVEERNPKCIDCYYYGHTSDVCKYEGCLLYKKV